MGPTSKVINLLMNGGVLWCSRTATYEEYNLNPSDVKGRVFVYKSMLDFEQNIEVCQSEDIRVFDTMVGTGILKLINAEQIEDGFVDELTINSTAVWANNDLVVPVRYCQQLGKEFLLK